MTEISSGKTLRQTKIIATLGPATDSAETIQALIESGVDAVRLNFSHGEADEHAQRVRLVREISKKMNYHIAVIGDLQGPKIRIERFRDGQVHLVDGQEFTLDPTIGKNDGDISRVGITYPHLAEDMHPGNILVLDDGRVLLEVLKVERMAIVTRVIQANILANNKGVNLRGGGLSAPSITEKDRQDVILAAQLGVDFLAISFPKDADDIRQAKALMREAGCKAALIAKIERAQALDHIDEIIQESEGIMVARGDLSIEIGDAVLTGVQKKLIRRAREKNRIAITATEMMQSMITSTVPTRAEISDVANAVLDGTDAVMLSAESAIGDHPIEAVKAMSRICAGAEQGDDGQKSDYQRPEKTKRIDMAVATASIHTAMALQVKTIAALTESGSTVLWMSRTCSSIPIYALTRHIETCRKVALYRGVYPNLLEEGEDKQLTELDEEVSAALLGRCAAEVGDFTIVTKGDKRGVHGGTNTMKIIRISQIK